MAHYAKYGKGAVGHMFGHYDRSKESVGDNVDVEKTHQNYNLAPERTSQLEFLRQRLSEVKVQKRADVNVMCDWIVTAPKDLLQHHPEKEAEFFRHTYAFLETKYGAANVVSAYVHKDETTPHMHFSFIPVVPDHKKGGFKVSAKECVTRSDLKTFHEQLQQYLEKQMGIEVNILNEATKEGNKSIAELRRETAAERLKIADAKAESIVLNAETQADDLLASMEAEYENKKKLLEPRSSTYQSRLNVTIEKDSSMFGLIGTGKNTVTMWESDYKKLLRDASDVENCKGYLDAAKRVYKAWRDDCVRLRRFDALDTELHKVKLKLNHTERTLAKWKADVTAALKSMSPEAQKEFQTHYKNITKPRSRNSSEYER